MAGEPQQDRLSTAEKAADLGLTDTEYRARSHAAAVAAVRAAIPGMYATVGFRLEDVLNEAAAERQDPAPDGTAGCGCPNEDAPEHGFGTEGCDCVPFTRQTTPPRILDRPTDTVDMISGWERGADCPHHARSGQPETDDTAVDRATLIDLVRDFLDPDPCSFDHHGYCQAHGYLGGEPGSCPHGRARKLLAAVEAAPSGQPETDDKAGS
jgi:hypothetical protein